jgi:hypothetical protein
LSAYGKYRIFRSEVSATTTAKVTSTSASTAEIATGSASKIIATTEIAAGSAAEIIATIIPVALILGFASLFFAPFFAQFIAYKPACRGS